MPFRPSSHDLQGQPGVAPAPTHPILDFLDRKRHLDEHSEGGSTPNINKTKITTGRITLPVGSTSSTTLVDMPGPTEFSFTKVYNDTSIVISGSLSHFMSTAIAASRPAVRVNSVDYEVAFFFWNTAGEHGNIPFVSDVITNLPLGTYTVRMRWRVSGGVAQTDNNDELRFMVHEF